MLLGRKDEAMLRVLFFSTTRPELTPNFSNAAADFPNAVAGFSDAASGGSLRNLVFGTVLLAPQK